MAERRIRVLLADDHPKVRDGLSRLLGELPDFEIAGQANNGQEAVRLARELLPDVVIMDVFMPRMNGIEATRVIRSELPRVRVLGLSSSDEAANEMRQAGAADYVNKTAPSDVIIEAIRKCGSSGPKQ